MNATFLKYNAYLTLDNGRTYRAIAIAGHWRLTLKINDSRYDFVDDIEYGSAAAALNAVTEKEVII